MLAVKGRWSAVVLVATAALLVESCAGLPGVPASSPASPASSSPALTPAVSARPSGPEGEGPTPTGSDPGDDGLGEVDAFEPPLPSCPAPATAVTAPALTVSAAGQAVAMVMGSSTVSTCSTTGTDDRADADPTDALLVPGDGGALTVSLADGWQFLWWEGFDTDADGEGANVRLGRETPERPLSIEIALPVRTGDSVLGVSAWAIRADGRAVAQIGGEALIRVP
jgi:hypothetical protein